MARPKPNRKDFVKISKSLLRARQAGVLSTALAGTDAGDKGWPYASLATLAPDMDGGPVFLFSELSDHCRNLMVDNRASLLLEKALNLSRPQTGPRVTVMGRMEKTDNPRHRARYLRYHPQAKNYADFGDFHFYKMQIEKARFVGGFAKAVWLRGDECLTGTDLANDFVEAEADITGHMNDDHADAVALMVKNVLGRKGRGWRMQGIDPDGVDFSGSTGFARINFDQPLTNVSDCRAELVKLAKLAGNP